MAGLFGSKNEYEINNSGTLNNPIFVATETKKVEKDKKTFENVEVITETTEGVRIDPNKNIKAYQRGNDVYIVFSNGTSFRLDSTTATYMIKNGIANQEFMAVTGKKKVVEYQVSKEKKRRLKAFALALLLLITSSLSLIRSSSKAEKNVMNTSLTEVQSIVKQDFQQDLSIIYQQYYQEIIENLRVGSIARQGQDAYQATEEDRDYLGMPHTSSVEIFDEYVIPTSTFVKKVNEFRQKYDGKEFTEDSFYLMIEDAKVLLSKYERLLNDVIGHVDMHIGTTQQTIDMGKKQTSYPYELTLLASQHNDLLNDLDNVKKVVESFNNINQTIENIKNGSCVVIQDEAGKIVLLDSSHLQNNAQQVESGGRKI